VATPDALPAASGVLPETAGVHWRPRADDRRLTGRGRLWTLTTAAHVVPFLLTGVFLLVLEPLTLPVALAAWAHAYLIPQAYASRGANVVRPRRFKATQAAEARSVGLLGDLIGHDARKLHARTGLVLERGRLGVWLVGPAGALLIRDAGRRVFCWCVRVNDPDLPAGDRIAHLLLALRADEQGFATVANMTFSGAPWRIRRRIPAAMRPAVDAAVASSVAAAPA
jgi:hypothetical protein